MYLTSSYQNPLPFCILNLLSQSPHKNKLQSPRWHGTRQPCSLWAMPNQWVMSGNSLADFLLFKDNFTFSQVFRMFLLSEQHLTLGFLKPGVPCQATALPHRENVTPTEPLRHLPIGKWRSFRLLLLLTGSLCRELVCTSLYFPERPV